MVKKNNVILLLLVFSFFFNIIGINKESYTQDEIFSVLGSKDALSDSIESTSGDTQLYFYNFMLWIWIKLFGISATATRMLSVIFSVVSSIFLYKLSTMIFNRRVGLYSSIFLIVSSFSIKYAQTARAYSLFMLITILCFYYLFRYFKYHTKNDLIKYLLFGFLLIHTHLFGILIIIIQSFIVLYLKKNKFIFYIQYFLYLNWFFIFIQKFSTRGAINWINYPTILDFWHTLLNLFGGKFIFSIFLFVIIFSYCKINRSEKKYLTILSIWVFFPVLCVYLVSLLFPIFVDRYFINLLPAASILIGFSISKLTIKRYGQMLVFFFIVILFISPLISNFNTIENTQWRESSAYIKENAKEKESIFFSPSFRIKYFIFYYDKNCLDSKSMYACAYNHNIIPVLNIYDNYDNDVINLNFLINPPKSNELNKIIWLIVRNEKTDRNSLVEPVEYWVGTQERIPYFNNQYYVIEKIPFNGLIIYKLFKL